MPAASEVALPAGVVLASGSHKTLASGACALEWVHVLDLQRQGKSVDSHTRLTDSPACACPVIAAFVRAWNDGLPDADRTRLLAPLVPVLCREHLPTWLDLAGLTEHAAAVRGLAEIRDTASAHAANETLRVTREAAAAARAAAWDAAGAAAWDAAWDALAPTVVQLQESAVDLVRRMCAVTPGAQP